jgi:hypothetical protein
LRIDSGLAILPAGATPAEFLAASWASPPRTRSKKGLMMPHLPSLKGYKSHSDFMSTESTLVRTWEHFENKGSEKAISVPQT